MQHEHFPFPAQVDEAKHFVHMIKIKFFKSKCNYEYVGRRNFASLLCKREWVFADVIFVCLVSNYFTILPFISLISTQNKFERL